MNEISFSTTMDLYEKNKLNIKEICNKYKPDFFGIDDSEMNNKIIIDFGWKEPLDFESYKEFKKAVLSIYRKEN